MTVLADHVAVHARLQPERIAAMELSSGRRWSYAALDLFIARLARVLRSRGCHPGARVACLARNRVALVALHLACARIGAIYVPLNWRLSPAELVLLVADADPTLVVGDDALTVAGLDGLSLDDLIAESDATAPLPMAVVDREQPSLILYTSGTSGRPKGVLLSERNIEQTAINFGRLGRVTHESVFLVEAPMFHIIGLITTVRPPFLHGGAILVSDGFEVRRSLDRIGDPSLGVTHYFCVPQVAAMLRSHQNYRPETFRRLTALFTGGAPHPAADIRAWLADGVAVADGFGMSEAGTVFGMPVDSDLIAARAGAAGVAMPGVMSRIVDAQDQDCSPGQAGELLLKGDNLFSGYWRRPDETAKAFTADGWFRTGDIAQADEQGFHWLVDRKKDMFISGGENVYPAEIEAALAGHPAIAECAVVGVPDPRWGEVGHLALAPCSGSVVTHEDIIAFLEPRLARYKLPKTTTVLEALPRTGSGKVQKGSLRALLLSSAPPETSQT